MEMNTLNIERENKYKQVQNKQIKYIIKDTKN